MGTFRTFGLCWEVFEGVKVYTSVTFFIVQISKGLMLYPTEGTVQL